MRNGILIALIVLASSASARADEQAAKSALDLVNELHTVIQDPDADWNAKSAAYKAAKDALEAEAEKAGEEGPKPAADAYAKIQADVATALRRDNLPLMGWVMGFFGASLMWGGLAVCIAIARKAGRAVDPKGD